MLSLTISIVFIIASAIIDKETLEYSYIYDHKSRALQRAVFFLCLSLYSITGALGGVLLFMALFDGILNKIRDKNILYLGSTARWDIFFKDKTLLYICVKVVTLFGGLYLCLI